MHKQENLTRETYSGIFAIVLTPFDDDLAIDEPGLENVVNFCLAAGVQGVVTTANVSEVGYLSDDERKRVAELIVGVVARRVKTVVGVSANHHRQSSIFAAHAESIGADAVMALPPTFHPTTPAETMTHYGAIARACSLPIVLQNAVGPGVTAMSAALISDVVRAVPTARFVKEETAYSAQTIGDMFREAGTSLEGVMGGRAGKPFMEEFRHGARGTMPACEFADVHVALWDAMERGDESKARDVFRRLLPLLDLELTYGVPFCKEVLRRRGLIASGAWRQSGFREMDAAAQAELDLLLEVINPEVLANYPIRTAFGTEKNNAMQHGSRS